VLRLRGKAGKNCRQEEEYDQMSGFHNSDQMCSLGTENQRCKNTIFTPFEKIFLFYVT
jgi:hypothetical protein